MRLHILQDQKIVCRTISFFEEVFPGGNKFIVLISSGKDGIFVKNDADRNVFCVNYRDNSFSKIVGDVNSYESVIVHFLFGDAIPFINSITHPNIYWIEWGADLYQGLLERKGFKIYRNPRDLSKFTHPHIPYCLFRAYTFLKREKLYRQMDRAIRKCRYFVPDSTPDEYQLLLSYYPQYSFLIQKEIFYYPIEEILGPLCDKRCTGDAIFVGNSCSFSNNHKYVFDLLHSAGVTNKVIAPLSYSGDKEYKNYVVRYGKECFGDNFCPLLDYLPLDEYNRLFLNARTFVFGNIRQEAVGNMIIAMYLGARLFLDKDNPMYDYYTRLGLVLNSLDDITLEMLNKPLSEEEVENNRKILGALYSNSRMRNLIRKNF